MSIFVCWNLFIKNFFKYEHEKCRHKVECERPIPVFYKEMHLDVGFRADMVIGGSVIIENKTVERLAPIHMAQLLIHLKLSKIHLGFLLK